MKIELLKTFIDVSHTLHIRISAQNLHLTQAAVSSRIKQLEEELGVMLFDRTNKRLKLTAEGDKLVKYANDMLAMWHKIKQEVGVAEGDGSQLFLGAMLSIWDMVLHDWLQKLHRNIDDVHLYTHTYSSVELRKRILNRLLDIAFLFEPPFTDEIVTKKVCTVPLVMVSTAPIKLPSELSNFVMVDYGDTINAMFLHHFGQELSPIHHMNHPNTAMAFILDAGGAAYLPRQMCFSELRRQQLFVVPNTPTFHRDVHAIYLANSHKRVLIEDSLMLFPYSIR
ncbi:LysR family transcriptional regulator (plasmid) [Vibrio nigripulchritudo]|uniref:LysR family transcriptional regulator n=1 Tax=Vibrio nigripulchritudo TaxID=28173 RepID=UPI00190D315B|nr:LysR family transcriptional regulator [Vibrio nigripulchritudo]BCL73825.1 LysR family transcriptional regulator [Vibrio nigripulchritudo]BDU35202.1 LysR family transcriptional regulator [Vibrio nigripulchritudo]